MERYLHLDQSPDTTDALLPGDIDLGGWELRKTLRLFSGCNYLRMAEKTLEANPPAAGIRCKQLFHILRPLLAFRWIATYRSMPPTTIEELLHWIKQTRI